MPTAKLFASLAQIAGTHSLTLEVSTVREFLRRCEETFGDAFTSQLPHCTIMLNGVGVDQASGLDIPLRNTDDFAILPPVAGG